MDFRGAAVLQLDGAWVRLAGALPPLIAREPSEVLPVIEAVDAAAEAGLHAAGFVAYEAAAAFGLESHAPVDGLPLAAFILADRLEPFDPGSLIGAAAAVPGLQWLPAVSEPGYLHAVKRVRQHLAAGDSYQVNLTFQLAADYAADPFALFARLARAQRADGAAYLDFGRFAIASASPELFFERHGETVVMRPMKGTAARGRTLAEDRNRAAALRRSPKERAENLMIVDMVRNDLGRIARTGSVSVPALFRVERFPTVLQMTSTVTASTEASLAGIFAATFPCASVTGAPKVRTASIIHDLESGPRGVYTGAVGYVGPGRRARFNVAIRTATIDRQRAIASYGVGSGIVWDSRGGREHDECMAKARVLHADASPFSLLETMRWIPGEGIARLDRHLARLAGSARYFGIPFSKARAREALLRGAQGEEPRRVRLLVGEDGRLKVETGLLPELSSGPVRAGLAANGPVDTSSPFLFHKTTRRTHYEAAAASRPDCDEVILWNSDGYVTETAIANLAVFHEGRWVTPPVSDGLLAGTFRAGLLDRGIVREGRIPAASLKPSTRLAAFNALRGWRELQFVPGPGARG